MNSHQNGMEEENNSVGDMVLHRQEVYAIVGCAMEVMNEIGHGFHEKPYENAIAVSASGGSACYVDSSQGPILKSCFFLPLHLCCPMQSKAMQFFERLGSLRNV